MVVFFERNAGFVPVDVRMFLHQKKFCDASSSATEARRSQCVARQWVAKKIAECVLQSCCNVASECLRTRAFFPSATQIFLFASLHDCNTEKKFGEVVPLDESVTSCRKTRMGSKSLWKIT